MKTSFSYLLGLCLATLGSLQVTHAQTIKTTGLSVQSPLEQGYVAYQGANLVVSTVVSERRYNSAFVVTIAKTDGTLNQTIINQPSAGVRVVSFWPVPKDFPVGDYNLQILITPNPSMPIALPPVVAPSGGGATGAPATTTRAAVPTAAPRPAGEITVYVWRSMITIKDEKSNPTPAGTAAATMTMAGQNGAIVTKMLVALGVLAMGAVFTL